MANTYTTNYNLAKPANGDINWHIPINGNFDTIDTTMKNNSPTGSIIMYGSTLAPDGWLLCDGSEVSRTTYADLFTIIGTTFGTGNGSTTFNLPDMRDRFVVGAGSTYNNNSKGGEVTHVLTTDEMPSHTHPITVIQSGGGALSYEPSIFGTYHGSTGATGGGLAHENRPPYIGITFIIKT